MRFRVLGFGFILATGLTGLACNTDNPARPSVTFLAPVAQGPEGEGTYRFSHQPVALHIENAVRTGTAAVTYDLEVATSSSFATIVVTRPGIAEGADGRTSVTLPQLDGNATYFWRWRAVVDGIAGQPSSPRSFFVRQRVVVGQPIAQAPAAAAVVFVARPTFVVGNAPVTGPNDPISYDFEVSSSDAFASLVASATVAAGGSTTSWTAGVDIPEGTFFWRSRAQDVANDAIGAWTDAVSFVRRNVIIGVPTPQSPTQGQAVFIARPWLVVANAQVTGTPLGAITYDFEVSLSPTFSPLLASATVPAGSSTTSWTVTTDLPEATIHWRARAKDATGGTLGAFTNAASFVRRILVIGRPTLQSPAQGETVSGLRPTFVLQNASVTGGQVGALRHDFEVSDSPSMRPLLVSASVPAGASTTPWTSPIDLPAGRPLYWRARGRDVQNGVEGEFADPISFQGQEFAHPLDEIDIRSVTIISRDADIREWEVTSILRSEDISYDGEQFCTPHTQSGEWPRVEKRYDDGTASYHEGNQWFFVNIDGKWVGGANEYLRPGQICKVLDAREHVGEGGYGSTILAGWNPRSGEIVGVAVTTMARFGQQGPVMERSNIVLFRWP